ncbi:MAG: hypothetical protein GX980_11935 [Firmicutes bacterium]|nr:hypothetical protein [Bacillota bacterium]
MYSEGELQKKFQRYQLFWEQAQVDRPLIGFSAGGYFPFTSYRAISALADEDVLEAHMLDPEAFWPDYERILKATTPIQDDVVRGAAPFPAIPWMEAMLGCTVRIAPGSIWAEEMCLSWDELETLQVDEGNPWLQKFLAFTEMLVERSAGRFPVGLPILRGVSDMLAALRGSSQVIYDLYDHPAEVHRLIDKLVDIFLMVINKMAELTGPFHGGYFIEQFALWAPGRLIRLQEDASALYSPPLFREFLQGSDRILASSTPFSLIHLHSSSLFLLEDILAIDELRVIQINKDVGGMPVPQMMPYLKMVQDAGKCLIVRGSLNHEDLSLFRKHLVPTGLYLQTVIDRPEDAGQYGEFLQDW